MVAPLYKAGFPCWFSLLGSHHLVSLPCVSRDTWQSFTSGCGAKEQANFRNKELCEVTFLLMKSLLACAKESFPNWSYVKKFSFESILFFLVVLTPTFLVRRTEGFYFPCQEERCVLPLQVTTWDTKADRALTFPPSLRLWFFLADPIKHLCNSSAHDGGEFFSSWCGYVTAQVFPTFMPELKFLICCFPDPPVNCDELRHSTEDRLVRETWRTRAELVSVFSQWLLKSTQTETETISRVLILRNV